MVEPIPPEHTVEVVNTNVRLFGRTPGAVEELWVFFMSAGGEVTAVFEDHVRRLATSEPLDGLVNTPDALLFGPTSQVKTRTPVTAMVAAAWSQVEKMF